MPRRPTRQVDRLSIRELERLLPEHFENMGIERSVTGIDSGAARTAVPANALPGYSIARDTETGRTHMSATGERPRRKQTTDPGKCGRRNSRSELASGTSEKECHECVRHAPCWSPQGLRQCGRRMRLGSCREQRDTPKAKVMHSRMGVGLEVIPKAETETVLESMRRQSAEELSPFDGQALCLKPTQTRKAQSRGT